MLQVDNFVDAAAADQLAAHFGQLCAGTTTPRTAQDATAGAGIHGATTDSDSDSDSDYGGYIPSAMASAATAVPATAVPAPAAAAVGTTGISQQAEAAARNFAPADKRVDAPIPAHGLRDMVLDEDGEELDEPFADPLVPSRGLVRPPAGMVGMDAADVLEEREGEGSAESSVVEAFEAIGEQQ